MKTHDPHIHGGLGLLRCRHDPSPAVLHRVKESVMRESTHRVGITRSMGVRAALLGVAMFAAGAAAATGVAHMAGWTIRIDPYTADQDIVVLKGEHGTVGLVVPEGQGQPVVNSLNNGGMLLELNADGTATPIQP